MLERDQRDQSRMFSMFGQSDPQRELLTRNNEGEGNERKFSVVGVDDIITSSEYINYTLFLSSDIMNV